MVSILTRDKNCAVGMLKLTTDKHEASRGLSATTELLVYSLSVGKLEHRCQESGTSSCGSAGVTLASVNLVVTWPTSLHCRRALYGAEIDSGITWLSADQQARWSAELSGRTFHGCQREKTCWGERSMVIDVTRLVREPYQPYQLNCVGAGVNIVTNKSSCK